MDNNKITSLPVSFSVENEVSDNDTRFIKVTIDVLHTGRNFNGSIFSKEVVNENIESINNTPILGYICESSNGEKDFKGHEYIISKKDGETYRKYIGSAYGTIPESCNPRWIEKICDDGQTREFLQVDALLWTKFDDSSSIILEDIVKSQSMELNPDSIDGYEDDNGDFVFTKFSFDGCCVLGDKCDPAMINSTVEVQFSMSDFVRNMQKELNDKYTAFTKLVDEQNKGGNETMPNTDFMQTVMEQFQDISTMVSSYEVVKDRWGDEVPRYCLKDIQENEVIVVDRNNNYQVYGFPFTMNGDKAEIDFACGGKRKKTTYTDYKDGETVIDNAFDFGNAIKEIEDNAFTKVEDANQKVSEAEDKVAKAEENYTQVKSDYETIKIEYEEIKPKYDEYVQEEQARINKEVEAQKEAEFARVENALAENVDFVALKEKKDELSVDEIRNQCALLYTRLSLEGKINFSKSEGQSVKAGLMDDIDDEDGYYACKYGNIPVRR